MGHITTITYVGSGPGHLHMPANAAIRPGQCCSAHYLRAANPLDGLPTCKTPRMIVARPTYFLAAHQHACRSATVMALRAKPPP
jgi:hypothetical protein